MNISSLGATKGWAKFFSKDNIGQKISKLLAYPVASFWEL